MAYFEDPWNYADMLYIWSSIITLILQNTAGPTALLSKILMITIVFLALLKTFFFLRIFTALSPIVTMLTNVIYDLRIFLLFYGILIFFCAAFARVGFVVSEIRFGNFTVENDDNFCESPRFSTKLPQQMRRTISKSWLAKFPRQGGP